MRLGVVGVHDMSSSADEEDEEESAVVRQPAPLAAAVHEISDSSSEAEDKGQEEYSRSKKTAAAALPSRRGGGGGGGGGRGGGRGGGCRATGTRARAGGGSKKKAGGISIEEEYPAWARDAATFNSPSTAAAPASSDRHEAEFRLLPGEFEVVLLVDTAVRDIFSLVPKSLEVSIPQFQKLFFLFRFYYAGDLWRRSGRPS